MARRSPREWYEAKKPGTDITFKFDVTFLLSRYNCIFGRGCQGAFGSELEGCCGSGAYFSGPKDIRQVARKIKYLTAEDQDRIPLATLRERWKTETGSEVKTRKIQGACVFLNTSGGCALHAAAVRRGEDYRDWKPEICWTIPIRAEWNEEECLITMWDTDEHGGWNTTRGKEGDEGYWCGKDPAAHSPDNEHTYVFFEQELRRICGDALYDEFAAYAKSRASGGLDTPQDMQPVSVVLGARQGARQGARKRASL